MGFTRWHGTELVGFVDLFADRPEYGEPPRPTIGVHPVDLCELMLYIFYIH